MGVVVDVVVVVVVDVVIVVVVLFVGGGLYFVFEIVDVGSYDSANSHKFVVWPDVSTSLVNLKTFDRIKSTRFLDFCVVAFP